jgi:D-amino-acid oxidase
MSTFLVLPHVSTSCSEAKHQNCYAANFVVIGAGVVGLVQALELRARHPHAKITVAGKYLPGDSAPEYTSAWGGANWFPAARDNGPQEDWEAITYRKFQELSATRPECGIKPMNIRWHYEQGIDQVGIKTPATGKLWFEDLVGGLIEIPKEELPSGCAFGFEMASFVIDVQKYLPWYVFRIMERHAVLPNTFEVIDYANPERRLQAECTKLGIEIHRRVFLHIRDAFRAYPNTTAIFNCTGIGALTLGGVEDKKIFSARVRAFTRSLRIDSLLLSKFPFLHVTFYSFSDQYTDFTVFI